MPISPVRRARVSGERGWVCLLWGRIQVSVCCSFIPLAFLPFYHSSQTPPPSLSNPSPPLSSKPYQHYSLHRTTHHSSTLPSSTPPLSTLNSGRKKPLPKHTLVPPQPIPNTDAAIPELRLRSLELAERCGQMLQLLRELGLHVVELRGGEGGEVDWVRCVSCGDFGGGKE